MVHVLSRGSLSSWASLVAKMVVSPLTIHFQVLDKSPVSGLGRGPSSCNSFDSKESARNAGDRGLIPGLGRSPGERNGFPLQYFSLENSMDRGALRATVCGVEKSWT